MSSRPGAQLHPDGTTFRLPSASAERIDLVLVHPDGASSVPATEHRPMRPSGQTWSGLPLWELHCPGIGAGQRYGYRVHGPWEPTAGLRANPAKLQLDPWARQIVGELDNDGPVLDHVPGQHHLRDDRDSLGHVPLGVVTEPVPRPRPLASPVPWSRTVLYELHTAGFTRRHPDLPPRLRGSYAGLGRPEVLRHLVDLGVTTVELLPIHHFVHEAHLTRRGRTNYWGYNTVGFFAPHAGHGATANPVAEFAALVDACHEAGLEVVLDVVHNHTGEGGADGPSMLFKGLDHGVWYRLDDEARHVDTTGCGNTLDTSQPAVLQFVLDSLRYWAEDLGVDGFRLDLAPAMLRDADHRVDLGHPFLAAIAADPVLSKRKLIAEPWDIGDGGYQVAQWPQPWAEWNDHYRNDVRDFWRGHGRGVRLLAQRLTGSHDLYDPAIRGRHASVSFLTAHDGFTLRDLVTYQHKHNHANGEDNRDGSDDNRSDNHGVEGETDDPWISGVRSRSLRNLLATLLLTEGTVMLTAGDEFGRTQQGNNNAYCRDDEVSWVDWEGARSDLLQFSRELLRIRRDRADQPEHVHWLSGGADPEHSTGCRVMTDDDWHDAERGHLGMLRPDGLLLWINGSSHEQSHTLPPGAWELAVCTAEAEEHPMVTAGRLPPRSVSLLRRHSAGTSDPTGGHPDRR